MLSKSKIIVGALLLFLSIPYPSLAQEPADTITTLTAPSYATNDVQMMPAKPDYYPAPQNSPGLYLLTLFDKKGEGQFVAKIIIDPDEKSVLRNFSFLIPGKDITVTRVLHERYTYETCYKPKVYPLPGQPATMMEKGSDDMPIDPAIRYNCYPSYVSRFTTLEPITSYVKEGLKVTVNASPDESSKIQEGLIIGYRSKSYTKGLFTNKYFHILTPQLPITSATVQVGIFTKDGLMLRDGGYTTGYTTSLRVLEKARNLVDEQNQELTNFSNDIMYQGQVRKGDSDVSPDSSFEADGVYGSNWALLYLTEALYVLVGIVVFIGLIIFVVRFIFKKNEHVKTIIIISIISIVVTLVVTLSVIAIIFFGRIGMGGPVFPG